MPKRIGLIVNPVAGMGGSVGLKGTDGEMYHKALQLGARPVTAGKTEELMAHIKNQDQIFWFVAPGRMGENFLPDRQLAHTVVGEIPSQTSAADTRRIARQMVDHGAELIVFVGGDGTARDVYDVLASTNIPVVAVPAGVKIFSSVFAFSTRAAAGMVDAFVQGTELTAEEVLDIDEDAFRDDRLDSRLYGYLLVPEVRQFLQPGKAASDMTTSSVENKQEIAAYIVEEMLPSVLYLLGPGTTVKAITDEMDLPKTLMGVDAVRDRRIVGLDLNEQGLLELLARYPQRKMIVTPIGGNGFIFGRGSKQFTPRVIQQVGINNILVVGTRAKVRLLESLRVDTGDFELDQALSGYIDVWVGYRHAIVRKVRC